MKYRNNREKSMKPTVGGPCAMEMWYPNHWIAREFPILLLIFNLISLQSENMIYIRS